MSQSNLAICVPQLLAQQREAKGQVASTARQLPRIGEYYRYSGDIRQMRPRVRPANDGSADLNVRPDPQITRGRQSGIGQLLPDGRT